MLTKQPFFHGAEKTSPATDSCLDHPAFRFYFVIHILIHAKVYMDEIVWQAQEVIHWSGIFL
jgi:hypothetical protein